MRTPATAEGGYLRAFALPPARLCLRRRLMPSTPPPPGSLSALLSFRPPLPPLRQRQPVEASGWMPMVAADSH